MKIGLLSAPSNLGLWPPAPTSVPGCAKAPEALREAGLHRRLAELGAHERGVVLPGRYADEAGRCVRPVSRCSVPVPCRSIRAA
jgi:arginase